MITWHDLYTVLAAVVPLYVAMILAYGSVRWWKIFSPDQCSGINRFVAIFAVPLLSFHFISTNDPYSMNFRFLAADTLQKLIVLAGLSVWLGISTGGGATLDWLITIFSVSTLPNTLVMGIPLLIAMYGPYSGSLMVQIVVLQCIIWYTLLLFLFEYRAAKMLIVEQFPDVAGEIVSLKVDSDVVSLVDGGPHFLEADAEVGGDGKLHVTVRKSTSSRRSLSLMMTPRPSNLTGAEIYSLSSSRNPTPRGSNFNHSDFYSMMSAAGGGGSGGCSSGPLGMAPGGPGRLSNFGLTDLYSSIQTSRGPTPRPSNFEENHVTYVSGSGSSPTPRYAAPQPAAQAHYPAPNPDIIASSASRLSHSAAAPRKSSSLYNAANSSSHDAKELHMFVWSASASPVSDAAGALHVFNGSGGDLDAKEIRMLVPPADAGHSKATGLLGADDLGSGGKGGDHADDESKTGAGVPMAPSNAELHPKAAAAALGSLGGAGKAGGGTAKPMPPASVMTRLILIMVWRKLIRNPNTYSSLIGIIWSLIAYRWNVAMPKIVEKSISILSDAGLGMAMFSLGLFMALQPRIIACGNRVAAFAMAVRFLTGPAVMAAASIAVGLRGTLLHVAIVQAALPQGIVPFVFAKEYNVHPAILSTAVIFGMLIALPITLVYYIILGL